MDNVIRREPVGEAALLAESAYDTEALFPSAEAAVKFALKAPACSATRDTLAPMMKSSGTRSAFARDEMPGQAGMILFALTPMTDLAKALLIARLALRSVPCNCRRACCSGWAVNPDWDNARAFLAMETVQALSGQMTHYGMRDGLVRKWAGEKVDIGRLADRCGVHRNTVTSHYNTLRPWLQQRYKQAVSQADALLRRSGLELEAITAGTEKSSSAQNVA